MEDLQIGVCLTVYIQILVEYAITGAIIRIRGVVLAKLAAKGSMLSSPIPRLNRTAESAPGGKIFVVVIKIEMSGHAMRLRLLAHCARRPASRALPRARSMTAPIIPRIATTTRSSISVNDFLSIACFSCEALLHSPTYLLLSVIFLRFSVLLRYYCIRERIVQDIFILILLCLTLQVWGYKIALLTEEVDMDFEKFDKPEDLFKNMGFKIPQFRFNKGILPIAGIIVIVIILLTGIYMTGPDQVGVIRRFGRYVRTTQPGLHLKIPIIEVVDNIPVKKIEKEEFGFRTAKAGVATRYSPREYFDESLMLTGDLNVLVVEWIVQYKRKDPVKWLFNIRYQRRTIRNISEAVMRQIVGDNTVNEVLTNRRVEINQEVQDKLQKILDSYNSGIQIVTVKLQDVNPPDPVKPSFNEVNEAKQEKEKMINQAWEAYNKVIPKARGEAEKTIKEAEGYALKRINTAKGDAARFTSVWEAYKSHKEVTKKRLYLEAMNEIFHKAGSKFIVDPSQKGILPLLNLNREGGVQ